MVSIITNKEFDKKLILDLFGKDISSIINKYLTIDLKLKKHVYYYSAGNEDIFSCILNIYLIKIEVQNYTYLLLFEQVLSNKDRFNIINHGKYCQKIEQNIINSEDEEGFSLRIDELIIVDKYWQRPEKLFVVDDWV